MSRHRGHDFSRKGERLGQADFALGRSGEPGIPSPQRSVRGRQVQPDRAERSEPRSGVA